MSSPPTRKLRKWPDAALAQPCAPVPVGEDCSALIEEMRYAMHFPLGIGLAANQLGELKRIIIVRVHPTCELVVINPEICWRSPSHEVLRKEGCLSFPGQVVWVPRNRHVKVTGYDQHWRPFICGGKDLQARALQHEVDHLNGVNMLQRAVDPKKWNAQAPLEPRKPT